MTEFQRVQPEGRLEDESDMNIESIYIIRNFLLTSLIVVSIDYVFED